MFFKRQGRGLQVLYFVLLHLLIINYNFPKYKTKDGAFVKYFSNLFSENNFAMSQN